MIKKVVFILVGLALIAYPFFASQSGTAAALSASPSPSVSPTTKPVPTTSPSVSPRKVKRQDWYVSTAGHDYNSYGTQEFPLRTIRLAIDNASPGNTVHILPGTYDENMVFDKDLTVIGESGKAKDTIINGLGDIPAVSVIQQADISLQNLTIQNGKVGLSLAAGGNADVDNCILHNNIDSSIIVIQGTATIQNSIIRDNGIKGDKARGINIIGCTIENCGEDAVNLLSSTVAINRNIIRNNKGSGIYINGGGSANIENNLIVKNQLFGVFCSGMNGRVLNNTISDNGTGGVSNVNPLSGLQQVFNNIIVFNGNDYNSSQNASYSDVGAGNPAGAHNISLDPQFVNRSKGDYHLQKGSPCIDAGTNDGVSEQDLDGNSRIFSDIVDMGCYEKGTKPRNNWYVSPGGSDSTGDGSLQQPLRDIQTAIGKAAPGNAIHILAGTYLENLNISKNLTLTGESGYASDVIIDGHRNGPVVKLVDVKCTIRMLTVQNGKDDGIFSSGGTLNLSNLNIRNNGGYGVSIHGSAGDQDVNAIQACTISANLKGGIATVSGYKTVIEGNKLINNNVIAIGVDNQNCDITKNIIRGTGGSGISSFESGLNITRNLIEDCTGSGIARLHAFASITGNIIRGNGGCGIDFGLSSMDITNNLIVNNKQYGLRPGAGDCKVVNNTIAYNKGGIYDVPDITPGSRQFVNNIVVYNGQDFTSPFTASYCNLGSGNLAGGHNISLDPQFVNAANGDYHLQAGSPCINAGSNIGAPSEDLEGNRRPIKGTVDMGCYESKF